MDNIKRNGFTLIELLAVIVITGSVNPNVEGTYIITYSLTDSSGNPTSVSRTVNVIAVILRQGTSGGPTVAYLNGPITKESIENIVFSNSSVVPGNALGSWDVSASNNGTIKAWYLDSNNNGLYELTIGSDQKIFANPTSSCLFCNLTNLKTINFTNFDTSKVTNMLRMFSSTTNLTTLDFRNATFDSVTNYSNMFNYTKNGVTIQTKNTTTKSWLESRLSEVSRTGNVVIAP